MEIDAGNFEVPRHPMRLVSQRTGLSAHVLRVWERRYGAVHPARSGGGQRLYTDADVLRLQLLHDAARAGRNIGQLVPLPNEALLALVAEDREQRTSASIRSPSPPTSGSLPGSDPVRIQTLCLAAVDRMDPRGLRAELSRAAVLLPLPLLTDEVLVPLLREIGTRWMEGRLGPGQEHAASAAIRQILADILRSCEPLPNALGIVVGTPAGQQHELGAMLVAVTAGALGWRVTYLGSDLPWSEIARAAEVVRARVVALSILYSEGDGHLRAELDSLVDALPRGRQLLLGGASASGYAGQLQHRDVLVIEDLAVLREDLARIAAGAAP